MSLLVSVFLNSVVLSQPVLSLLYLFEKLFFTVRRKQFSFRLSLVCTCAACVYICLELWGKYISVVPVVETPLCQ